ncbi:hypothetical protein KME73_02440 [Latilactobacillus curvatus]|uniref:hypothetical protein n=1 Tax=Latilactobacillus curvatus TaxID=28038 RepID=UPI001C0049B4|nr:hypothetical protein [Latilactobacillus curvatus]QWF36065.1 hypothetical protein KME73_02440 [Latilactobacillus curvatus]
MKILFVVGSCLRVNTSANLCHIAYINGCVKAGDDVDVISMSEKGSVVDKSIKLPYVSNWFTFDPPYHNNIPVTTVGSSAKKIDVRGTSRNFFKQFILNFYGIYGHTASIWVHRARKFKSDKKYDMVISLATPYVSHYLTYLLIRSGHIKYDKWIQIWEDPWALDLYNTKKKKKQWEEENRLLSYPDKVVYSSPLTLKYQRKAFPKHMEKMTWHTLPYYYKNETTSVNKVDKVYGYYGDYYSFSRNLKPFYDAAKQTNINVKIYGNSDLNISTTKLIDVKPRVGLEKLSEAEDKTDVLVFLCNLRGGQIPGKLYQYSATNKPILFILDGTIEEMKILKKYFSQFNRYFFCNNDINSISAAIMHINANELGSIKNYPVDEFSPESTMKALL